MTVDLWPTLERSLVAYPPETFAGAESWSVEAVNALRDRWVRERLLGRGELVRILERTNDPHASRSCLTSRCGGCCCPRARRG